jgi:hypothetical protein
LTPDELCRGGISFYRHKETALFGRDAASFRASGKSTREFLRHVDDLVMRDGPHEDRWEETSRIDLRYNRLILFNPRLFHRTNSQFGDTVENARISQGFSCYARDDPFRYRVWT